jgi:hypothetical protein
MLLDGMFRFTMTGKEFSIDLVRFQAGLFAKLILETAQQTHYAL